RREATEKGGSLLDAQVAGQLARLVLRAVFVAWKLAGKRTECARQGQQEGDFAEAEHAVLSAPTPVQLLYTSRSLQAFSWRLRKPVQPLKKAGRGWGGRRRRPRLRAVTDVLSCVGPTPFRCRFWAVLSRS